MVGWNAKSSRVPSLGLVPAIFAEWVLSQPAAYRAHGSLARSDDRCYALLTGPPAQLVSDGGHPNRRLSGDAFLSQRAQPICAGIGPRCVGFPGVPGSARLDQPSFVCWAQVVSALKWG